MCCVALLPVPVPVTAPMAMPVCCVLCFGLVVRRCDFGLTLFSAPHPPPKASVSVLQGMYALTASQPAAAVAHFRCAISQLEAAPSLHHRSAAAALWSRKAQDPLLNVARCELALALLAEGRPDAVGTATDALGPLASESVVSALPSVQDRALASLAAGAVAQARGAPQEAKTLFTAALKLAHGQMEGRQMVALALVPIAYAFLRIEGEPARALEMCASPLPLSPLPLSPLPLSPTPVPRIHQIPKGGAR